MLTYDPIARGVTPVGGVMEGSSRKDLRTILRTPSGAADLRCLDFLTESVDICKHGRRSV